MKILYVTPSFQHPQVRGSNRHYHFLRELAQRHDITLLTLERTPIAAQAMSEISEYTRRLFTFKTYTPLAGAAKWLKGLPLLGDEIVQHTALRRGVLQMKRVFRELVEQEAFDVVLFHGKDCYPVIDGWRRLPLVIDFCDATSFRVRNQMRYVSRQKAVLLRLRYMQVRRVEKRMIAATPRLAFISHRDREVILGPGSNAVVIPNGIDLHYWRRRTEQPQARRLIFTGIMSYAPNEDAALYLIDRILPRLRVLSPGIEVIIAGREPSVALQERAWQHSDVTVTGFVPDLRDCLEKAAVFAAPLRYASGMQNKIQEALAMEIPVVTTSLVAEGLRVEKTEKAPLYVADDDGQFAQRIVDLLQRPEERVRLAAEGRQYAEKHFVWSRSAQQLEQMCFEAIPSLVHQPRQNHTVSVR
jgi:glycosyltransferase involved in cell wall biosynthesis